ncbi:MAG: hydrogenase maturation nickel metallochaperone HypA [Nitrospira bacterium HGW-Nitrospira-1]|nr:MAG: hydrogenase maturation nickel metallochaperone HypA [Nitrospira bacterium HGW-Nitrospira-1]
MHELSLAQNLLDIVSAQCLKNGFKEIESINIRIGRASGIMPDALSFAFNAIKTDSAVANKAFLYIEEIPVTGNCKDCNNEFIVEEEYILCCPSCNGSSFVITAGRELDIVDMEVS